MDRPRCCQSLHGSNTPGCVDVDKHQMNTMSECQVEAEERVREVNDGGTEVNEGRGNI